MVNPLVQSLLLKTVTCIIFFHPLYEAAVGVLLEIMPIVVVRFGRLNIGCLCCKALVNCCDY